MNDAEELAKLAELHARGVLSDEEFAKAKARVLGGQTAYGAGAAPAWRIGLCASSGQKIAAQPGATRNADAVDGWR